MTELIENAQGVVSALVFAVGACVGSFLNVCIYRIPLEQSIILPGSHCPQCQKPIAWYDNIPILSYFILRGKCRSCGASFSARYAVVELLTAILFLLIWLRYGVSPVTPIYFVAVSGLVLASFVDLDHMIIPDRVSIGGMMLGLVLSAFFPVLHGQEGSWSGLMSSGSGLAIGFGSLWLVSVLGKWAFKKDAMGFGDVKLLGAIGAFVGWRGVLMTVMISSLLGTMIGLAFIFGGKQEWQSKIPYGPYLALGAIIWMLWGMDWWTAYVEWMSAAY